MSEMVTVSYEDAKRDFITEERDRHEKKYNSYMSRDRTFEALAELDAHWYWDRTFNLIYKNMRVTYVDLTYADSFTRKLNIKQTIRYFEAEKARAEHKMNYWAARSKSYLSNESLRADEYGFKVHVITEIIDTWEEELRHEW